MSSDLKIGEQVRWTKTSMRGRSMSMELREGTVVAVDGDRVQVKTRRGRAQWLAASAVQRAGEETDIGRTVRMLRESARREDGWN